MANRAIWDVRQRHVWLSEPLKSKRVKRRTRLRCGLQEAIERKGGEGDTAPAEASEEPAQGEG